MTAAPLPAAAQPQGVAPLISAAFRVPPSVQIQIRQHRRCAPEHAGIVRAACLHDRTVLPRWHQDDRGRDNAHRGVHVEAPEGAYAPLPAWNSREHWLAFTVPITIAQHPEILAKHRISPEFFREAAKIKSGYADPSSGRRCIVRPDTLASVLDVTKRHVRAFNACARELGLEVVVLTGRMLTLNERYHCWKLGSRQRGLATEVALTTPQLLRGVVDQFTPARGRGRSRKTHRRSTSLHGLTAEREKEAASPPPLRERWRRKRAARRLAADVVSAVPWCASERPGRLTAALMRFATAPTPWTGEDIANAITTHTMRTGRGRIEPDRIRTRPAALLASILRGLDIQADHPGLGTDGFDDAGTRPERPSGLPVVPLPCRRADCDGHGWLPENEHGAAVPCPDCDPGLRSTGAADLPAVVLDPDGQPPF